MTEYAFKQLGIDIENPDLSDSDISALIDSLKRLLAIRAMANPNLTYWSFMQEHRPKGMFFFHVSRIGILNHPMSVKGFEEVTILDLCALIESREILSIRGAGRKSVINHLKLFHEFDLISDKFYNEQLLVYSSLTSNYYS